MVFKIAFLWFLLAFTQKLKFSRGEENILTSNYTKIVKKAPKLEQDLESCNRSETEYSFVDCLSQLWLDAGCISEGFMFPEKLSRKDISEYNKMTIR